jgi:predicted  nucleic acid-binding Zn-ribbon protein
MVTSNATYKLRKVELDTMHSNFDKLKEMEHRAMEAMRHADMEHRKLGEKIRELEKKIIRKERQLAELETSRISNRSKLDWSGISYRPKSRR